MVEAFLRAGAHYLTNADWGCLDGHHTAWIIVETDDEAQARHMVPPVIRNTALLVKPNKFTPEQIMSCHKEDPLPSPQ